MTYLALDVFRIRHYFQLLRSKQVGWRSAIRSNSPLESGIGYGGDPESAWGNIAIGYSLEGDDPLEGSGTILKRIRHGST